jgi:protein-tyrosine phosphatase
MTKDNSSIAVLFVCMGNICRSPTAEGVFRHYVAEQGYAKAIRIDSAGTIAAHAGEPADPRMCTAAAQRGYTLDSIARAVSDDDLHDFDLIVAMDRANFAYLHQLGNGPATLVMLGGYVPGAVPEGVASEVPDPYYGGAAGFDTVIDMIESACPALFDHCLALIAAHAKSGHPN